jgi:hypothetical protein
MSYIKGRGFGDYATTTVSTEFPYHDLPAKGMGCAGDCGCGGTCGGHGHDHGPYSGMGLFDSMDPTTWGVGEYAVAAVGGYLAVKLAGDVSKTTRKVRRGAKSALQRSSTGAKTGVAGLGKIALIAGLGYGAYLLWQKSQAGAGLGAYMPQKYVAPQILVAPCNSSQIRIPAGW